MSFFHFIYIYIKCCFICKYIKTGIYKVNKFFENRKYVYELFNIHSFIVKVVINKIFLFIQAECDLQILKTKYTNCVSKVAIVLFMMIALK